LRHCLLPLGLFSLLTACQPQVSTTALGTLERDRVLLTATASEIIRALPVAQGSMTSARIRRLPPRSRALA